MRRIFLFLLFISSYCAQGQEVTIITYPNGAPQYLITHTGDTILKNVCLSVFGDTIYTWDTRTATFTDYPITGMYLLPTEYDTFKKQLLTRHAIDKKQIDITTLSPPSPRKNEWNLMYEYFFKRCPDHKIIVRQGPFTVVTGYRNNIQDGLYQKYYKDTMVVQGQYKNGSRSGIWTYHAYTFYPYEDKEVADLYGKSFSLYYGIIPGMILAIFILLFGIQAAGSNNYYLIYFYVVILLSCIALYIRLDVIYDRQNIWIRETIPAIWFSLWHCMMLQAAVNLFLSRKLKTPVFLNMVCILVGLAFSFFILFFKHLNF
ncbi:MAG: hypothetical protein H0X33_02380 [Taibaiella sp.]|nr:hypothetical protein [Taibaiella sp.]